MRVHLQLSGMRGPQVGRRRIKSVVASQAKVEKKGRFLVSSPPPPPLLNTRFHFHPHGAYSLFSDYGQFWSSALWTTITDETRNLFLGLEGDHFWPRTFSRPLHQWSFIHCFDSEQII
ncbi:hypothetical protein CEXT_64561 [Caerostris extrusa]|uniref:Uncharacterized protein n=1 Tax=Caerostris extrusa TaxID=172846 RepID=A0AAV4R1J0_CAEEX|nr:hypothetical protein CEXT_64561 [Caerostris extrusa]